MTDLPLESRLRLLELQLGLLGQKDDAAEKDLTARVEALERTYSSSVSSSSSTATTWKEIDDLLEELSAGTALTHQKQIMAPVIYRRQEVLACSDTLKADLESLAEIQNLLLISQKNDSNKASQLLTEENVVNSPILLSMADMTEPEQKQLDELSATTLNLQRRTDAAAQKLDRMLHNYQQLTAAVSEKLVIIHEELNLRKA